MEKTDVIQLFYRKKCSWRFRTAELMLIRWQTWSCSQLKLWLCPSLMGSRTSRGSRTLVYIVSHPSLGYTSSPPQCQWPLPGGTQSQHTMFTRVVERESPDDAVSYHSGYCFKVEARQFDDVSKFEYGTERSVHWIIKACADIAGINPLHQITPGKTADLYNTPHISQSSLFSLRWMERHLNWKDSDLLPCDTKQREGDGVFDEQRVVLRRHQEWRARRRSEHTRARLNPVGADRREQSRAERRSCSVWVHTLGWSDHSLWGTRPAPRTSWWYAHTRPSFLLQTHTGNVY